MSEVILFLVIVALCGLLGWKEYNDRKERQKLIQAIMSKNAQDLVNFEMADKVDRITPTPPLINPEDFTAENELTEKEFDTHILGKKENG